MRALPDSAARPSSASGRERAVAWLDRFFGLDLRALGVLRILLAGIVLLDLVERLRGGGLVAHYTERGVFPPEVATLIAPGAGVSLHGLLSGSVLAEALLFGATAAAALALLVGLHTRIATVVAWGLVASLQLANPMVADGFDRLLRVLLLWGALLPLGARFSLDARRSSGSGAPPRRVLSVATVGIVLQVCAVYWITAVMKHGDTWIDGRALYYALHLDFFGTPWGAWLREQQALLPWLTHGSRWLEILGPFLLFVPVRTAAFRLAAVASFWSFHLGIWIFMSVGLFSLLSMAMWLLVLPSSFCDRVAALTRGADAGRPGLLRAPRWVELIALVPLAYLVLALGAHSLRPVLGRSAPLPGPVELVGKGLRMRQQWAMFAPNPPYRDYWPVMVGRLESGELVDAFRGTPLSWERPQPVSKAFRSFKWRLYFSALLRATVEDRLGVAVTPPLADYVCREWNEAHADGERLRSVELVWMIEVTQDDRIEPPVRVPTEVQRCDG